MRTVGRMLLLSMAASLISVGGTACALSKMWRAEVRQAGRVPCFSIGNNRDTRHVPTALAALSVHELDQRDVASKTVWELGVRVGSSEEPPKLSPDVCMVYGERPAGMAELTQAAVLVSGKRYQVSINTDLGELPRTENRRYRAYFCLVRRGDQVIVQDVLWDERTGERRWDVCKA